MFSLNTLFAALLPLFMAVQPSPAQKKAFDPAGVKTVQPPAYSALAPELLGTKWYAFYLMDKKNIGSLEEITSRRTLDGREVYEMRDRMRTALPPSHFDSAAHALSDADFTLIRVENEMTEKNDETGEIKTERIICESAGRGSARCQAWSSDSNATETLSFQTENGEPLYYDGAIDRLQRVYKIENGARLKLHFIDLTKKKLKYMFSSPRGNETVDINGRKTDVRKVYNFVPDDDIQSTVSLSDKNAFVSLFWTDGEMKITAYPAENEKSARAERMKFVAQIPPADRTPQQVVIVMLTAMAQKRADLLESCFDFKKMHSAFAERMPGAELPDFEAWKTQIIGFMTNPPEESGQEPQSKVDSSEMAMFLEAVSGEIMSVEINGDTAAVKMTQNGVADDSSILLTKTKDGWKIFWLDSMGLPEDDMDEE